MFKSIFIHCVVGGGLFLLFVFFYDVYHIPKEFIAVPIIYGLVALADILPKLNKPMKTAVSSASEAITTAVQERESKKARQDLIEYKKLFDEGILSKEEYELKVISLKKKIV